MMALEYRSALNKTDRSKPLTSSREIASGRGVPLYVQVARILKDDIVNGVAPVGSLLPTEDELRVRFSISRHTVREALRRLREDGLVSSRQGAGTIVAPVRNTDAYVHHVMSMGDLVAFATGARFVLESSMMVVLDAEAAARTGLSTGQNWLEVQGLRVTETVDQPACWTEYYINSAFAAVGRLMRRHNGPVFPLIEDLFSVTIAEVHQEITATIGSDVLADRLKVEAGTAALIVRRSYMTSDGTVAQVTINTYPASRFSHSMMMRRLKI